ncbi:MAG TPA: T9SS type A sorting domain-containing protein, partial [Clostridiales bacterium]|nr:T9SS type A sorting domain-containing protein [Clostridiales bacterium]
NFNLEQNYPNPFNPVTEIRFSINNDANVKLAVYNIKGELVSNLKNEKMVKGLHTVNFDASNLNSGVYFYKLSVDGMAETKKMVLTK